MAVCTLPLQAFGARLRPADTDDAAFIVTQRRAPRARAYLGDTSEVLADQQRWLARQRAQADDYYFVCVDANARRLGTIGLYDRAGDTAQWGRFLVRSGSKAAPVCLYLLLSFAFDKLGLRHLYCQTVAHNARAISFYEWAGFCADPHPTDGNATPAPSVCIAGANVALRRHGASRDAWPAMQQVLARACAANEARL